MRVIITNDDGIDAPGIHALCAAAARLPHLELIVVAPQGAWSGCGHALTTGRTFAVEARPRTEWAAQRWAVAGTPADCVRAALTHLAPGAQAVLSGINHGGNLGFDVHCSGTVAAAREAASHGVRGIACSHYQRRGLAVDWTQAATWLAGILPELLAEPRGYVSVNLPHLEPGSAPPAAQRCPLDPSPLPLAMDYSSEGLRYCGDYHQRERIPGADVDVCMGGRISIVEVG
jgi:5'-nucleotidase